ncbi:MAG TPA: hypothetical protein VI485_05830 [Vicinamibacterales bacterium]|nr:hypothetical protein [Vicinamibacterales bacterium]
MIGCRTNQLTRSPFLGEKFPHFWNQFNGNLHRGVRRRFVGRFVLGYRFFVRL